MKYFLILLAFMALNGCVSTKSSPPPPGAIEYREVQEKIQQKQTELAITGVKIEGDSREIVEGITAVESTLAAPEYDRAVLANQIHDLRVIAEKHQADTETLNRQLAEEREAGSRLGEIFNEREEEWQKAVSERETAITSLKVENKKVAGQRNTLLAIVLTAFGVILIIIVVKVLRALKIIPI
jgi:hypothetical protein